VNRYSSKRVAGPSGHDGHRSIFMASFNRCRFVAKFGSEPKAAEILPARLLDALKQVHAAKDVGIALPEDIKFNIFNASFHCEQEVTVAPGVKQAVAGFDCPILRGLILRPVVRFCFFPRRHYMFFKDFSETEERITRGMSAYRLAQEAGWEHVLDSMKAYGVMPESYFEDPQKAYREIPGAY